MTKLFKELPQPTPVELSIGTVYLKPLLVKHAKLFESITDINGDAGKQHVMLAMLLKELLVDEYGDPFEDLKNMSQDAITENLTFEDFATLLRKMTPKVEEKLPNV